ncbi:MAG: hypothetical protein LBC83_02785 [Oscillospiraceae bacterium]|jgi:hypothetical protein|nr:hypothetical protein [Oscillospiraceae bacterium]
MFKRSIGCALLVIMLFTLLSGMVFAAPVVAEQSTGQAVAAEPPGSLPPDAPEQGAVTAFTSASVPYSAPDTARDAPLVADDAALPEARTAQTPAEFVRDNVLELAALGAAGLALLLAVVALAKSGKGKRRKNYSYF